MEQERGASESPSTLVAIIVAARRVGDRELERQARRRLEERFSVKLTFLRERAVSDKARS
jgi:hypothetical protein